MFVRSAKWFIVTALVLTLGGQWAFLQIVAWTGMAVSYSQTDCITVALSKTFDGKHPCKMCHLVSSGKAAQKKSEAKLDLKKLDFISGASIRFCFPPLPQTISENQFVFSSTLFVPAFPPPKSLEQFV